MTSSALYSLQNWRQSSFKNRVICVPHLIPGAVRHGKFSAAVALPVNRHCSFLIGKSVDMDLIRNHECGIKAQAEMTDDLIVVGLVLIFLNEISPRRKRRSG